MVYQQGTRQCLRDFSDEQKSALRALKSALDVVRKEAPLIDVTELVATISGLLEGEAFTAEAVTRWQLWDGGLEDNKSVAYRMFKRLGRGQYGNDKNWKDGLKFFEEAQAFDERAKPQIPSLKGLNLGRAMAKEILRTP